MWVRMEVHAWRCASFSVKLQQSFSIGNSPVANGDGACIGGGSGKECEVGRRHIRRKAMVCPNIKSAISRVSHSAWEQYTNMAIRMFRALTDCSLTDSFVRAIVRGM
jgi:hypothetical protein